MYPSSRERGTESPISRGAASNGDWNPAKRVHPVKIYTLREVAVILRVHYSTVFRLVHQGGIRGFKIGSDWRIAEDAIVELMARGEAKHRASRPIVLGKNAS